MDHPADSTAKLCQGGKGRYVGREGIPMDDSSGKECEPVIVREGGNHQNMWRDEGVQTHNPLHVLQSDYKSEVLLPEQCMVTGFAGS